MRSFPRSFLRKSPSESVVCPKSPKGATLQVLPLTFFCVKDCFTDEEWQVGVSASVGKSLKKGQMYCGMEKEQLESKLLQMSDAGREPTRGANKANKAKRFRRRIQDRTKLDKPLDVRLHSLSLHFVCFAAPKTQTTVRLFLLEILPILQRFQSHTRQPHLKVWGSPTPTPAYRGHRIFQARSL